MTDLAFAAPEPVTAAIADSAARFPIHRVYCIGRNYADHAREMGAVPDRGSPVYFLKPGDSIVPLPGDVRYPPATSDLHHEVELVVALHRGGRDIAPADAPACVFGYAIGLDLTRRDLQAAAKAKSLPWDTGKSFEQAAPLGPIHRVDEVGHLDIGAITLEVNGETRQRGDLADRLFTVAEIIVGLSRLFTLAPGDLVFTGTPAGVGPLCIGDRFRASIDGLGSVDGHIIGDA
jgi:fumarylpyruvate hydrolase